MRLVGWIFFWGIICFVVIGGVWKKMYDGKSRFPDQLKIAGLESPVEIQWGEFDTAQIQANSLSDALSGLGYVQGRLNGWTIALWRQAALGKLSDWYGADAIEADRLVQLLDLSGNAQNAGRHLPPAEASLMASFGKGIDLAWQDTDSMHDFFLQNIRPEPWEPWHALAIERLIAWMSTSPDSLCLLGEPICAGTARLDSMILVHGLESSSAWLLPTSRGAVFYQRHVLGNSTAPVFQDVALTIANEPDMYGTSLIGTPFFPAGKMGNRAWSILLHSAKTIQPADFGLKRERRFSFRDREEIVYYQKSDSTLYIDGAPKELAWNGLGPGTDAPAWFALFRNQPTGFQLWRGDGILMSSDSSWTVLGAPNFVFPLHRSGFMISNDSSAAYNAYYLNQIDPDLTDPSDWITDTWSAWVEDTLSEELDSLRIPENAPPLVQSALVYLRNWNHTFEGQSIGATIYNQWSISEGSTREIAFYRAVDQLAQKFGTDQSQWRWERVHTGRYLFTLHGHSGSRMHAPLTFPLIGHQSTMHWGGNRAAAAPAIWESWTRDESDTPYFIRRQHLNLHQPFGRYLFDHADYSVFSLPAPHLDSTVLVPDDTE